ncbi:MAG: enolase C-terminal domain-like protein [Myxococcota bacterium]
MQGAMQGEAGGAAADAAQGVPADAAQGAARERVAVDRAPQLDAACLERVVVTACTFPTDGPDGEETDGTLAWRATTIVIVELESGGQRGLGYTYGDVSTAHFLESKLVPIVLGRDPSDVPSLWHAMFEAIRNAGRPGLGAMAVSAVDVALWDLQARRLGMPLFRLLGPFRERTPVYGSGGFCNYSEARLVEQLTDWVAQGIPRVKLKTSRDPARDPARLRAVRGALGDGPTLMTDANGALDRKAGLYWAQRFRAEWDVAWLEEPVSSEDRAGLRLIRDQAPPGLEIAAGEYGYVLRDFADLLEAGAVDCLQADVTRCGGITGLRQVAGLCAAHAIDLSAHCAPAVSSHAFCAVERLRHVEYFHDHVRLEHRLFEGLPTLRDGALVPDPTRPGLGLALAERAAEPWVVHRRELRR